MPDLAWTDFANPRLNFQIKQYNKNMINAKYKKPSFRRAYWDWNNTNLGIPDLGQINVTFPGMTLVVWTLYLYYKV